MGSIGEAGAVSLHIERLVLDGLPLTAAQAARMQLALERELARLIAGSGDAGAWDPAAAPPATAVATPAVRWDATRPHQLGRALAHSVFASFNSSSPAGAGPRGRS
ncbi:MAG TPA: hypothetical protein VK601_27495 [Kofleriaceae bacterium]|nr:hypothetical protein [Kofleriaceae bacterium]